MKKIKLLTVCLMLVLTVSGCGSRAAKVREKLDLGSKYIEELDYDNAIEVLYEAIDIDPKDPDAYMMLAEVYIKDANVDKAKEILEEALEIEDLSEEKENEINEKLSGLLYLVTISKAAGEYDEPFVLELSNLSDKDIYYTIESKNSRLATAEVKYTGPILLDEDGDYKIKAYTFDSDKKANDAIKAKYSIKLSKKYKEKNSWVHYGDIYRYRGEDSKIVTKWKEIDGKWYYFMDNGDMATGTVDIDGSKYHFNNVGVMLTDWQNIDGKWYYFAEDGEMIENQYVGTYYVGADGAMVDEAETPKTETSDDSDVKKLYRDVLTKIYTTKELQGLYEYDPNAEMEISELHDPRYTLLDVTGDGKEELIVYVGIGIAGIYGVKGGKISLLMKTSMDESSYILYDNTIVCTFRTHNAEIGGSTFSCFRYNNATGKFEEYRSGLAATNEEAEEYDADETAFLDSLLNNVKAEIWEAANIPLTPENIAALK